VQSQSDCALLTEAGFFERAWAVGASEDQSRDNPSKKMTAKQGRDSARKGISTGKGTSTKRRWKRVSSSRSWCTKRIGPLQSSI